MNKRVLITSSLIVLFFIGSTFAVEVGYVYNSKSKIDSNVIGIFNELGLNVDYLQVNNLPSDISKYNFLYVGDEYVNPNISLTNYNFIISNRYLGEKTGITDRGGISIMTSTETPKVTFDSKNLAVYIVSKDNSGIYIPYYFLSNKHKAFSVEEYAGTYSTSSGNFGDVISFVNKSSVLENGKVANGNICFFGIIKSAYWTDDAKKLFKDCVGFVNVKSDNSPNNTQTITCSSNSDCGISGYLSDDFCSENDVFTTYIDYRCVNSGTSTSYCSNTTTNELVEECSDFCVSGECQSFKCTNEDQCDDYDATTQDICLNPLTKNSECVNLPYFIQCRLDFDCNDNNLSTIDTCINPSTKESSCVHNIYHIRCSNDSDCNDNNALTIDSCSNPGKFLSSCVHNIYHIRCSKDSDCNDNNALTIDSCSNPGQANSSCSFLTINNISYIKIVSLTAIPDKRSVRLNFNVEVFGSNSIKGYYFSNNKINWDFVNNNESFYVFGNLTPNTNYTFFMKAVDNLDISSSEFNVSVATLIDNGSNTGNNTNGTGNNNTGNGNNSSSNQTPEDNGNGGGGGGGSAGSSTSAGSLSNRASSGGICVTKWSCTEWSSCKDSKQTRNCYYPPDFCTPKQEKPIETQDCVEPVISEEVEVNNSSEDEINSGFSITGGVIGALKSPISWVIIFLVLVAGAYSYLRFRSGAFLLKKFWK
ncbi:fibronectin type III domain-containing protein [Candidatus Pacearchaeota archaeon]|nr:fibronectin type III domain-containing protein [Candidatus Pacearchaeota archaeon]